MMAYSDFTLKRIKAELGVDLVENRSIFSDVESIEISDYLRETLKRNIPLALAINTEKARSELIIINILLEVRERLSNRISLFSGIDFNIDKERGLTGFCDFIISCSAEQLYLDSPVITIVEAKNENIIAGLGQCIAEMYAARIYNEKDGRNLSYLYGAVTTGDEWKFIRMETDRVFIDLDVYYVSNVEKIVGILAAMAQQQA